MEVNAHATLNAVLNGLASIFLLWGYIRIRRNRQEWERHRSVMLFALGLSAAFLVSYLIYHYQVGSVPYPVHDWTYTVYLIILIPHIILAALMVPFIVWMVIAALRGRFTIHRRIARWTWPVWMYVSVSGVVVYLMLYILPHN